ncbi:MAG: CDC48 family AAA ATPase [Candidatus Hodarchaeota archaeon]
MVKEAQLRVAEAKQRDVGRGKIRLDSLSMRTIGVTTGDVVEIRGKKVTAAIAWPAYPEDQGGGICRMDGIIRRNSGVSLGDKIFVRKADVKAAQNVTLAPSQYSVSIDLGFENFVKRKLLGFPVTRGDQVLIPILGRAIPFVVTAGFPRGIILITETTQLKVTDKPVPEAGVKAARVTYEDIGGLDEEIQRVREMIELPLRHPELFTRLGIDPPKGVLLHGPPGCGKTLIAKAVANESEAHFISINGPEIMSKFYGESEQRLRQIFKEAEENSPTIIFIDEIDAIAPKREEVTGEVERRVVAQLLALMDGLVSRKQVIVIGATNRPNAVDPALRRPGRFDREIEIGVPDRKGRLEVLHIHTRGMPLSTDVDLEKVSDMCHGFVGADIAALAREAAMKALRRYLPEINLDDEVIPQEILEKMEVNMEDFLGAMHEVQPSAIREVLIEIPSITWDDIGGLEEAKQRLIEVIEWPLKHREAFTRLGIDPPKGIILYGPPGCGKTLLAKAVAHESEANFIAVKGPEVLSKWVGESEKAIREVFRKARTAAPCIIFFDEIDAIAPQRGSDFGDSRVTERVISQLLTELDGVEILRDVVVLAATNVPWLVDRALLRHGRMDRFIRVKAPNLEGKLEILKIYTQKMPLAGDVNLEKIAVESEGFSGADLEAIAKEAGILALREDINIKEVRMDHFEESMKYVHSSITEEIEKRYEDFEESSKRKIAPIQLGYTKSYV